MEIPKNCKVLVLAPHTDDGEFGCGGTIAKFVEAGSRVYMAAFSACEQSVLKKYPADVLISEIKRATAVLGIAPEDLFLFDFQVRIFTDKRQEILQKLIDLRETIKPDIVFMPSLNDIHQDHYVIANEGLKALNNSFRRIPTITTSSGPGSSLSFFRKEISLIGPIGLIFIAAAAITEMIF